MKFRGKEMGLRREGVGSKLGGRLRDTTIEMARKVGVA